MLTMVIGYWTSYLPMAPSESSLRRTTDWQSDSTRRMLGQWEEQHAEPEESICGQMITSSRSVLCLLKKPNGCCLFQSRATANKHRLQPIDFSRAEARA